MLCSQSKLMFSGKTAYCSYHCIADVKETTLLGTYVCVKLLLLPVATCQIDTEKQLTADGIQVICWLRFSVSRDLLISVLMCLETPSYKLQCVHSCFWCILDTGMYQLWIPEGLSRFCFWDTGHFKSGKVMEFKTYFTLSDESINQGLVCAHMHFIARTQKILTFMS